MPTTTRQLFRSTLAAALGALVCASCGSSSSNGDPYNGVVFASDGATISFDAKFLASTVCPKGSPNSSACYIRQTGTVNGKTVAFINLLPILSTSKTTAPGSIQPPVISGFSTPAAIPLTVADHQANGSGGQHVDQISACTAALSYDPRTDAYSSFTQAPIWDSLPLFPSSGTAWPIVATFSVTGVDSLTCNTVKDSRSIANPSDPTANPSGPAAVSPYGAVRSATPTGYNLWVPIDQNAVDKNGLVGALYTNGVQTGPGVAAKQGWYRGLQLFYLDGGPVPTDATSSTPATQFLAMDGVILNNGTTPAPATSDNPETIVAKLTANGQILLPYNPGDAGYSPIVKLHPYNVPTTGTKPTSICLTKPCAATAVDVTTLPKSDFTIFIVSSN